MRPNGRASGKKGEPDFVCNSLFTIDLSVLLAFFMHNSG